jgi:hypothetical protein
VKSQPFFGSNSPYSTLNKCDINVKGIQKKTLDYRDENAFHYTKFQKDSWPERPDG